MSFSYTGVLTACLESADDGSIRIEYASNQFVSGKRGQYEYCRQLRLTDILEANLKSG